MEVVLVILGQTRILCQCSDLSSTSWFITYSSHYLNVVVMSMVVDLSMNWFGDSSEVCICVVVVFSIRDTPGEFVFDPPSKIACVSQGDFGSLVRRS